MSHNSILQIQDHVENGLYARSIFGLNLFTANSVLIEAAQDPRNIFLQHLVERNLSSAHMGATAFEGDTPAEFFGVTEQFFLASHIGIYRSTFYYSRNDANGCFFPIANAIYNGKQFDNLRYLISCDAISLYIGRWAVDDMQNHGFLDREISSSTEWLDEITQLYSIVILSHEDGWHFTALSRDFAHFRLLDTSIQKAKHSIETSPWYVANKDRLTWSNMNGDYDNCLKINE